MKNSSDKSRNTKNAFRKNKLEISSKQRAILHNVRLNAAHARIYSLKFHSTGNIPTDVFYIENIFRTAQLVKTKLQS